jgi:hypothetical protein
MGLTGTGTLVGAFVLLLLATIATCLFWNRVTGPVRWPSRVALLLACDVSAILIVALLLNSQFDFYLSWSELLGQHPSLVATATHVGSDDARLERQLDVSYRTGHGVVVALEIPGTASGVATNPASVYLPPQYGDPEYANVQFPVIELLDGFPGSPRTWVKSLDIASVLDHEIATGQMSPTVVVMPTQNVASPRDTECANVLNGPQVDTYLTTDVRSAVDAAFRVYHGGQHWAVSGYSTGGYCAALLAAQHHGFYAAAASIEGYNAADHDATTGDLFGRRASLTDNADLLWWVSQRPMSKVALLELSTRQDKQSYLDDRTLDRVAAEHDWPVSQITLPRGGHNMGTFAAEVPLALDWLTQYTGAPLAPAPSVDGLRPQPVKSVNQVLGFSHHHGQHQVMSRRVRLPARVLTSSAHHR